MKKFTFYTLVLALTLISAARVNAQDVVDLTASGDPNVLLDTLDGVNNGAIILLKPGMTYNAGGYAFDSSITIQSSEPLNLDRPKIDCQANYNIVADATVDSLIFRNLEFLHFYTEIIIADIHIEFILMFFNIMPE